jgi:hypothetical protein
LPTRCDQKRHLSVLAGGDGMALTDRCTRWWGDPKAAPSAMVIRLSLWWLPSGHGLQARPDSGR